MSTKFDSASAEFVFWLASLVLLIVAFIILILVKDVLGFFVFLVLANISWIFSFYYEVREYDSKS